MKVRKNFVILGLACVLLALPANGAANKSSVKLEAPAAVEKGSEIIIKILVSHKGNNFLHYTNWVELKINDKIVQRWTFAAFSRPEDEIFSKEIFYKITEQITISAEANCNIHGSEGPATRRVLLASEENE